MNYFNEDTFNQIKKGELKTSLDTEIWYNKTYSNYLRILESNKMEKGKIGFYGPDDFVLAASFAFSWLARIPRLHYSSGVEFPFADAKLCAYFYNIDNGLFNSDLDLEIVNELTVHLDNSIIAVSKMLHFLTPNYFPIIDSKVINTWNKWFPQYKLPKKVNVKQYLDYAQNMRDWSVKTGVSLRDLEKALFRFDL